ncbi:MAG: trehalose-6-phosphate synthase [Chloroflexi bacterium]|nr:trehalose-6-phosphate synthase [Chloroflexota bacterium]
MVSNREPYVHGFSGKRIVCQRPVSGLTEALDPVLRAARGTWVAHGSGSADRQVTDAHDRVKVPSENPEYTLRRVWLSDEEVAGHYRGFSNEVMWPLCHIAFVPPVFRDTDWEMYRKVNEKFARAVLDEVGDRPAVVLVQDYHLALLSRLIKAQRPRLVVGQFWHIPWTPYEVFRTCPWREELLAGLLGNDLLGFHTPAYCENFLDTTRHILRAKVNQKAASVTHQGRPTLVKPFPISVDFARLSEEAGTEAVRQEMARLSRELNLAGKLVGIGVDRLDYTKGIPQRLQALGRFLENFPAYRGRVVFIQAGIPSRTDIESYQEVGRQVHELAAGINSRYGSSSWQPVLLMTGQLSPVALSALRRLASFCVVSALHDGMNLVAKEFVASRADEDGVLILSEFAGAAAELKEAVLVNPFAIGEFAVKINEALEMSETERRRRMKAMRAVVAGHSIYRWAASILEQLISLAEA